MIKIKVLKKIQYKLAKLVKNEKIWNCLYLERPIYRSIKDYIFRELRDND